MVPQDVEKIKQAFEDQEFTAVLNVYPREQAKARYRNWERWANVPYQVDTINISEQC